jgi:hypothetical protein
MPAMKITKTPDAWIVEPHTSDERKCLAMLFEALQEKYGTLVSGGDLPQANYQQALDHDRNKAA